MLWSNNFLAILLTCFVAASTSAKVVYLFNDRGEQNPFYDQSLKKIELGDVLVMPDQAEFQVKSSMKAGKTTALFQVVQTAPAVVYPTKIWIRLPLAEGEFPGSQGHEPYSEFINKTIDGERELDKAKIPHPKVLRSMRKVYAVVEDFPHDFSAKEFLLNPNGIPHSTLIKAEKSFYDFISTTSPYSKLGDFKADNVVYNIKKDQWSFLDWTQGHINAGTIWKDSAVDYLEERLLDEILLFPGNGRRSERILRNARNVVNAQRWINFGTTKCGYVYSLLRGLIPGGGRPVPVPQ